MTFQFTRKDKTDTSDDEYKLISDECQEGEPNNAMKSRISNGIIDKAVSQMSLGIQSGFNQEERKAFQEFCTKAGQWERNFGKDESPALAGVGLPKLPYASESPARLFKTDSWAQIK